jgi:hypothetical protein
VCARVWVWVCARVRVSVDVCVWCGVACNERQNTDVCVVCACACVSCDEYVTYGTG